MGQYKCRNCGYVGRDLIFRFSTYAYCVATNSEEPEYLNEPPYWVRDKAIGDAEVGEPVGCPECHSWGTSNFERI